MDERFSQSCDMFENPDSSEQDAYSHSVSYHFTSQLCGTEWEEN